MKQNSRGAVLLIPLIFLASVAVIVLSFLIIKSPTHIKNDPEAAIESTTKQEVRNVTPGWQAYSNSKYGVTLEYPESWVAIDQGAPFYFSKESGRRYMAKGQVLFKNPKSNYEEILMFVYDLTDPNHLEHFNQTQDDALKVEPYKVGDNLFELHTEVKLNTAPDYYKRLDFYANKDKSGQHGAKMRIGTRLGTFTSEDVDKEVVDQILSTFQFTNRSLSFRDAE